MSTATQTQPPESSRYVDYDEFIDFQVQKTRRGIKSNDLLTALIGAAVAVLGYLLVFAVFDHWVIEGGFGRGTRTVLLSLLLVGLSGWFVWKLAIPYFKRISVLYAASQLEETEPGFHSTLLTLVDLKQAGRSVSPEIRAALEKRAGLGLTHMDVEHAVDRRLLMRLSYVLLGLVVITCLYTILSPKKLSNSLWRSLLPTAAVAVDTRTRIDRVEPGDADVLARSQLVVTAELSGEMPDEVTLRYSTADRRLVDEPITMRETDDGIRQFRGVITGENGRGILQNLTYHVAAGDARSEIFTVTVSQPPSATVDEVQYEYPSYMAFRDRVQIGGAIDAWEGTWVTIRATANMPVKSALVMFSDTDDITQKAEELPVTIENGTLLTARWQLRIRTDGTYPNFYRIQCRNEAGKTDPSPALHPIKIRPDQPPQIQLAQPDSDLERPANAIVPLLFAAQDPDFLLRSVVLRFERNGESLPQSPRLYEGPPYRKSVTGTHDLDLGPLALQPGDKLTYWLEARDNMEPFADRAGNRSNTPRLNITITEPASPEEIQQQLEQDRQQVEERLDEAQQQSEGADAQPTPAEPEDADPEDSAETPSRPPGDEPPAGEEQPGDEAPSDQAEQESGEQGDSQSQPGGESSESGEQSSGEQAGSPDGEDSQESQGQEQGESSQGNKPGDQQAPFDDLLKRLMQRESPPAEQGEQDDASDQPQTQNDRQQGDSETPQQRPPSDNDRRPADEQPGGDQSGDDQSGDQENRSDDRQEAGPDGQPSASEDSASPSSDSRKGDGTSQSSSSPDDKTPRSAGDPTQPTPPNDRPSDSPQPGDGTEPSADAENPNVREGSTKGGEPTRDESASPPPGQESADSPDAAGGQREKPDGTETGDPKMSRNEDQPNSGDRKPAPEGTKADPSAKRDPTTTKGGEQPPGATPPQGSPDGSEQSSSESGNQSGQSSGSPQPGEKGGSPPSSPGQPGGSPKKPGDASSPPGEKGQSGQKGGQSGDQPDGQQGKGPQPSSEDESSPSADGQEPGGDNPPMDGAQEDGEKNAGEKGGGEKGGGEKGGGEKGGEEAGGQKDAGGQQESGGQAGGKPGGDQQGGGQQGGDEQGGQQAGGKPGSGGSANGSAQTSQGGGSGPAGEHDPNRPPDPNGQAGGGAPAERGDGDGEGTAADSIQGEDPDLEAKRKAANLLLKRLQDQLQRGEIDPGLQEELGVTDEQLKSFTKRLQQRLSDTGEDTSPEAQARRRQFEETLRTLEYESTGTQRAGGDGPRQGSRGFAGPQRTTPLRFRDATRAYQEKLSRQRKASN